jgi:cyclopropane-fatty-acyl-phospholipid synthase
MHQLQSKIRRRNAAGAQEFVIDTLSRAGIAVDGTSPGDTQIRDSRFFDRVMAEGTLGLGESYMDGWWDVQRLDVFFTKCLRARLDEQAKSKHQLLLYLKSLLLNMQSRTRARRVAQTHYNLGNEFYADMLGPGMHYTCAYWDEAETLEEAQNAKCELICKKLKLQPGDSVLDVGCGWGGFAEYAAKRYGCRVTAYNIAEEQVRYARERCKDLDVEVVLDDYRSAKGSYDKIVSIGLFEHVGPKNYRPAMEILERCLKEDGLFLLHTIGGNETRMATDPWVEKYIFPGGVLPSVQKLAESAEQLFVLEHFHSFGHDYDKTLMAWYDNFRNSWFKYENEYGERFFRMWSYYLLGCAGAFRARRNQLWQCVFSKHGVPGGYNALTWTAKRDNEPLIEREHEYADS